MLLVLTFDFSGDEYMLYINGILDATVTPALSAPTLTTGALGDYYNRMGSYVCGCTFAEFAVFGRVLTASEISVLYHNQRYLKDMVGFHQPLARNRYYYDADNDRIYVLTPSGAKYLTLT